MKGTRTILTAALADEYAREGVVRLRAVFRSAEVEGMRENLWRRVQACCGAVRDRPDSWKVERPSQLGAKPGDFAAVGSPAVRGLLSDLLGDWIEPQRWAVPLVCFPTPQARRWDVPHQNWHLDVPAEQQGPAVARLFVVLEPAEPRGGATLYVAGAHRLTRELAAAAGHPLPSAEARKRLCARFPWLADLQSERPGEDRVARFMDEGEEVGGVHLRVAEMLGEPGDLILMDPQMLHAPSMNVRRSPRMMLTAFVHGTRRG